MGTGPWGPGSSSFSRLGSPRRVCAPESPADPSLRPSSSPAEAGLGVLQSQGISYAPSPEGRAFGPSGLVAGVGSCAGKGRAPRGTFGAGGRTGPHEGLRGRATRVARAGARGRRGRASRRAPCRHAPVGSRGGTGPSAPPAPDPRPEPPAPPRNAPPAPNPRLRPRNAPPAPNPRLRPEMPLPPRNNLPPRNPRARTPNPCPARIPSRPTPGERRVPSRPSGSLTPARPTQHRTPVVGRSGARGAVQALSPRERDTGPRGVTGMGSEGGARGSPASPSWRRRRGVLPETGDW